jgi:hypothetical protein
MLGLLTLQNRDPAVHFDNSLFQDASAIQISARREGHFTRSRVFARSGVVFLVRLPLWDGLHGGVPFALPAWLL